MTQTSTYDRILHSLGLAALALNGAAMAYPKAIPVWLLIVALVIAGVAQTSTMPVVARPDSIIKAAKSAGGSVLPLLILAGFLGLTAFGCPPASTTPGAGTVVSLDAGPTPVATFDACAEKVVMDKAMGLLGLIAQATVGGDYMGALATLATQYGLPEVECAAQLFVDTMRRKASMDDTALLQRERAQMWLAKTVTSGH